MQQPVCGVLEEGEEEEEEEEEEEGGGWKTTFSLFLNCASRPGAKTGIYLVIVVVVWARGKRGEEKKRLLGMSEIEK